MLFLFVCLFVFVFILDEHSWHAIDVFVRLPKCRFNSAIILLPKKLNLFFLGLFGNISGFIFFNLLWLIGECKTLK